jgi:hypothetical protein
MGKNDGGPAFPTMGSDTVFLSSGMTLRDYFAAKALEGSLASLEPNESWDEKRAAKWCYEMADAMLSAREGK